MELHRSIASPPKAPLQLSERKSAIASHLDNQNPSENQGGLQHGNSWADFWIFYKFVSGFMGKEKIWKHCSKLWKPEIFGKGGGVQILHQGLLRLCAGLPYTAAVHRDQRSGLISPRGGVRGSSLTIEDDTPWPSISHLPRLLCPTIGSHSQTG